MKRLLWALLVILTSETLRAGDLYVSPVEYSGLCQLATGPCETVTGTGFIYEGTNGDYTRNDGDLYAFIWRNLTGKPAVIGLEFPKQDLSRPDATITFRVEGRSTRSFVIRVGLSAISADGTKKFSGKPVSVEIKKGDNKVSFRPSDIGLASDLSKSITGLFITATGREAKSFAISYLLFSNVTPVHEASSAVRKESIPRPTLVTRQTKSSTACTSSYPSPYASTICRIEGQRSDGSFMPLVSGIRRIEKMNGGLVVEASVAEWVNLPEGAGAAASAIAETLLTATKVRPIKVYVYASDWSYTAGRSDVDWEDTIGAEFWAYTSDDREPRWIDCVSPSINGQRKKSWRLAPAEMPKPRPTPYRPALE